MDVPSLDVFKVRMSFEQPVWCKVSLPMVEGCNWMIFTVPLNPDHFEILNSMCGGDFGKLKAVDPLRGKTFQELPAGRGERVRIMCLLLNLKSKKK